MPGSMRPAPASHLCVLRMLRPTDLQAMWSLVTLRPLGRIIPPGVIHRAVGDKLFAKRPGSKCSWHRLFKCRTVQPIAATDLRYLDLRVEVQWQKEAMDSGKLVAKCPGCSFLVLCNEQEASTTLVELWKAGRSPQPAICDISATSD